MGLSLVRVSWTGFLDSRTILGLMMPRSSKHLFTITLGLFGLLAGCGASGRDLSGTYKGSAASGEATTKAGPVAASNLSVTVQIEKGQDASPNVVVRVMGKSDLARTVECKGSATRSKEGELEKLVVTGAKCDGGGSVDKAYEACLYTGGTITLKEESGGKFALEKFDAKLNEGGPGEVCRQSTSVLALAGITATGLSS